MSRRRFGATRHTPNSAGELLQLPVVRWLAVCELALVVAGVLAVR